MTQPTLVVSPKGGADHRRIQHAVTAAPPGARILIRPGSYEESVIIDGDVELAADGPAGTVVVVSGDAAITVRGGSVRLSGLVLRQRGSAHGVLGRLANRSEAPSPKRKQGSPESAAVMVTGGRVRLEGCEISAETEFAVRADGAATIVEASDCQIYRAAAGFAVLGGSTAAIEDTTFNEWLLDALWTKGVGSRIEARGCAFRGGAAQAVFVDGGAGAIIESSSVSRVPAAFFVGGSGTSVEIRSNTIEGCSTVGIGVAWGGQALVEDNIVTACDVAINAVGERTRVRVRGGRLEGNRIGLGSTGGAGTSGGSFDVLGGETGIEAAGSKTRVQLEDCRIRGASKAAIHARDHAILSIDRGELTTSGIGLFAEDAGTEVNLRRVAVHGNAGPGITVAAGSSAMIEGCDFSANEYPGIAVVGGILSASDNRVHGNRSNGIAIRDGSDATLERNEIWDNALPAVTVVGPATRARLANNHVHNNAGQGIYVYQGASAEVAGNHLADNGGAGITVSDPGTSAEVTDNTLEGGDLGIWLADNARATLKANRVLSPNAPGILVTSGAFADAHGNQVEGAKVGVAIEGAGGAFTENRLLANLAGSWCLIEAGPLRRKANEEEALPIPGWAAEVLDPGKYPLFALRVASDLGVPPAAVEHIGSAYGLAELAARLDQAPVGDWPELADQHLTAYRHDMMEANAAAGVRSADRDRGEIIAHLEQTDVVAAGQPVRPTLIPGIVETLSIVLPSGAGAPLAAWPDEKEEDLFAAGEQRVREHLRVTELALAVLDVPGFVIEAPYSASVALQHLAEWCPEVVGTGGVIALPGDGKRLLVVPVNDSSIAFALPTLVGAAAGTWIRAAWRLRPTLVWLSPDRTDVFEIEVGADDTVVGVRAPEDLARLLARLPEPSRRIPEGWMDEVGLTEDASMRLLAIVRLEVLGRMTVDISQLPVLSGRVLVDVAHAVSGTSSTTWTEKVKATFDAMVAERCKLDYITREAAYEEARPYLWIQLDRAGAGSPTGITRPVSTGLVSSLVVCTKGRTRNAHRSLGPHWGVTEEQMWADALENVFAADIHTECVAGPLMKYTVSDHEAEGIGLVLHRIPSPPAHGHLLAFIHKGAAYAIRIDDRSALANLDQFAGFVRRIHARAAAFSDELSSRVHWLKPDGTIVELFDSNAAARVSPPAEFTALVRRLSGVA